jgi:hypothetical protein
MADAVIMPNGITSRQRTIFPPLTIGVALVQKDRHR